MRRAAVPAAGRGPPERPADRPGGAGRTARRDDPLGARGAEGHRRASERGDRDPRADPRRARSPAPRPSDSRPRRAAIWRALRRVGAQVGAFAGRQRPAGRAACSARCCSPPAASCGDMTAVVVFRAPRDETRRPRRSARARSSWVWWPASRAGATPVVGVETIGYPALPDAAGTTTAASSSVDNVDEVAGRAALVFALAGANGAYGVKDTAQALVPQRRRRPAALARLGGRSRRLLALVVALGVAALIVGPTLRALSAAGLERENYRGRRLPLPAGVAIVAAAALALVPLARARGAGGVERAATELRLVALYALGVCLPGPVRRRAGRRAARLARARGGGARRRPEQRRAEGRRLAGAGDARPQRPGAGAAAVPGRGRRAGAGHQPVQPARPASGPLVQGVRRAGRRR